MIHSIIPYEMIFEDSPDSGVRKDVMYNGVTVMVSGNTVERIISTNPREYLKHYDIVGKRLDSGELTSE